MNVQEYILSGVVESYVLGLSNAEEKAEFERMCAAHSEVRAARDAFEQLLEKQLLSQAIAPPANLKSKIISEIDIENDKRQGKKVVSMKQSPAMQSGWLRYVAAAAVILLVGSTIMNFYFFTQYRKYISKYDDLVATQTQMAKLNETLQTKVQDYQAQLNIFSDTSMSIVRMLPAAPDGPAIGGHTTVYWSGNSKDVYLVVNNLPKPAVDKQYQLWAIVDGQPVDAGVFDIQNGPVKMKNIPNAQAFAITLEPKGGSTAPTMPIYVVGKTTG
ncbi:MAG: anti-sigma factor [Bacteroidetes bacterium]|nr:anti-sigma factor [Bacteroidota bacterium]